MNSRYNNKGVKTIIYNKLSGINTSDEIEISLKLANILDIEDGNTNELKYFYYLNNKEKVDKLVSKDTYTLYEERKIDSDELLDIKLNLITDTMINNMSDIEMALADIGELTTRELAKKHKPLGLEENKKVAKMGGHAAKVARDDIEKNLGENVVSKDNALSYKYIEDDLMIENNDYIY